MDAGNQSKDPGAHGRDAVDWRGLLAYFITKYSKSIILRFPYLNEYDIDDAIASAFGKAYRNFHSFDPSRCDGDIRRWIKAIISNEIRDLIRARIERREAGTPPDHLRVFAPSAPEAEANSRRMEAMKRLEEILNSLSNVDRLIVLASAEGEGTRWAAGLEQELGLSSGVIRMRAFRIKRMIYDKMRGFLQPPREETSP